LPKLLTEVYCHVFTQRHVQTVIIPADTHEHLVAEIASGSWRLLSRSRSRIY